MKKVLALSLFVMAALVSQAWGAWTSCFSPKQYCRWLPSGNNEGSCWELNKGETDTEDCAAKRTECLKYGYLYTGVPEAGVGAGKKCEGGTWMGEGNDPNFTVVYCKWDTGCEAVRDQAEKDNCKTNGSVFSDAACTNWTGEGKDPNAVALGCCKWNTETGCYTIYEGKDAEGVDGAAKVQDCQGGENKFWAGKCPSEGTCPSTDPVYPPTDPIIKFTPASQALIVAPFGRSLHISSVRDAMVSLYDMSGARVYSGRVRAGNSVFGLEKVPSGSYYAIVQSGSNYKKVAVVLK